jgi:chromosome segregation ATPase
VNSGADQLKAEYVRLSSEIVALHAELEDYVAAAEQRSKELEDYRSAAEQRTKELDDERTRARALEDELVRAKASERWRVGGVLAVPASAVKRRLVR